MFPVVDKAVYVFVVAALTFDLEISFSLVNASIPCFPLSTKKIAYVVVVF